MLKLIRGTEESPCQELMEVHHIGDIGSFLGGAATDIQDGADEYILVTDPDSTPYVSTISIRDGYTGGQLWQVVLGPAYDGAFVGWDVAGGKNLVGDAYPDFALSAHGRNRGEVLVYDGHHPNQGPAIIAVGFDPAIDGGKLSAGFGFSVDVLGDLDDPPFIVADGYSELVVGDRDYEADPSFVDPGAVHILNLHNGDPLGHYVQRTITRPRHDVGIYGSSMSHDGSFGWDVRVIGDSWDSSDLANRRWGHDFMPEFAASGPYWEPLDEADPRGMWALYGTDLDLQPDDEVVYLDSTNTRMLFRGVPEQMLGLYVSGPFDPNMDEIAGTYLPYSVLWGGERTTGVNVPVFGAGVFYQYGPPTPHVHPNYNLAGFFCDARRSARSGTAIGDIDLDGFDDYALVNTVTGTNCTGQHEVLVYSGANPSTLLDCVDEWQGLALSGSCESNGVGFDRQCTTTVNRLGDVDLDGLPDFGIVSGVDVNGDFASDVSVVLIYGSNSLPPVGVGQGPPPPFVPQVGGNRVSQVLLATAGLYDSTRVAIRVQNCQPGVSVELYEGSLLSPPQWVSQCGGSLKVLDPDGPVLLTANADGVAHYVDHRNASSTPIGTKRYFQVIARRTAPPTTCWISQVHNLEYVPSTNVYQLLPQ